MLKQLAVIIGLTAVISVQSAVASPYGVEVIENLLVEQAEANNVASSFNWTCYAYDACGRSWEGCGICFDHAHDKALARCTNNSREPWTCKVNENNCRRT